MEYNPRQLKEIQARLILICKDVQKADGFKSLLVYSDYSAWTSHALLAGYNVEKDTGKMYKQTGNVRTYYAP